MKYSQMVFVLLVVLISACSLAPASSMVEQAITAAASPVEENSAVPASTFTAVPTDPPTRAATDITATNEPTPELPVATTCAVNRDWPVYTVAAGDTLSAIAGWAGSTVSELVAGNCLANANVIVVGMSLRVPREVVRPIAATTTHTPQPTVSSGAHLGVRGTLGAYPAEQVPGDWSRYIAEPDVPVTITWTGVEPEYYQNIGKTTFTYLSDQGERILMGVDEDRSDGISVTWTPPLGASGSVTGTAEYGTAGDWITSSTLQLEVRQ